jgi:P2 family phage contractile tail tube protein
MAGENLMAEKLINFRVYNDDSDLLGIATVDLPQIQAMTDTVSGAGIAGEVESPVLGHFQSMTTTFNWRTIEPKAMALAKQKAHTIDLRGSQQAYDAGSGEYSTVPVRATLKVVPKSFNLGTFDPGKTTGSTTEFEVQYLKLYVDGKEVAEIDKYNYIAKFGDDDALASVRADLGLA